MNLKVFLQHFHSKTYNYCALLGTSQTQFILNFQTERLQTQFINKQSAHKNLYDQFAIYLCFPSHSLCIGFESESGRRGDQSRKLLNSNYHYQIDFVLFSYMFHHIKLDSFCFFI